MAGADDLRAAALRLPGVTERPQLGTPSFWVNGKSFLLIWGERAVMKLDRARQELLFEVRPEVFAPMQAGAMRWSYVAYDAIDAEEAAALVLEAWRTVAPKAMVRAYQPL